MARRWSPASCPTRNLRAASRIPLSDSGHYKKTNSSDEISSMSCSVQDQSRFLLLGSMVTMREGGAEKPILTWIIAAIEHLVEKLVQYLVLLKFYRGFLCLGFMQQLHFLMIRENLYFLMVSSSA